MLKTEGHLKKQEAIGRDLTANTGRRAVLEKTTAFLYERRKSERVRVETEIL